MIVSILEELKWKCADIASTTGDEARAELN